MKPTAPAVACGAAASAFAGVAAVVQSHRRQLEFLLGAEVRVQAALADAGGGGQVPDGQAFQPVDGGQVRGRAQDRAAGAFPVGPRLPRRAAAQSRRDRGRCGGI
jgi:hypothetical protein